MSDYQRFNKAVKNTGGRECTVTAASQGFGRHRLQICVQLLNKRSNYRPIGPFTPGTKTIKITTGS